MQILIEALPSHREPAGTAAVFCLLVIPGRVDPVPATGGVINSTSHPCWPPCPSSAKFDLMHLPRIVWLTLLSCVALQPRLAAADESSAHDLPDLSIATIYEEHLFNEQGYSGQWAEDSSGYHRSIDSLETHGGRDIVLIEPATGTTNILVAAQDLIPPGQSAPLGIASYAFSKDRSKLLLFTNTKPVWRYHDRGDYWVLDRSSLELRQLGGGAAPSSLMHAKLSPDGRYVGYVRERNLYVEECRTGQLRQLTTTPNHHVINGAFDWVYEEEFMMRDGWRWSPDGRMIVFWEIDSSDVRQFPLIDHVSGLYPEIRWIPYPKTGEQNSSARAGVVAVDGGEVTWLQIPGDPRNHYLHSIEWPDHAPGIIVQQLNRLQNTNRLFIADPATGAARELLSETDPAWVDVFTRHRWIGDGERFPWLSERDGWQRLYAVDAESGRTKELFDAELDVMDLVQFVPEIGRAHV